MKVFSRPTALLCALAILAAAFVSTPSAQAFRVLDEKLNWVRTDVGTGWSPVSYSHIFNPGDADGNGFEDMMTVDRQGRMWLYPASSRTKFSARKQVGWGWNAMRGVYGGVDFTGDGNTDLLGVDSVGTLWVYPGRGTGYFAAKRQLGTGWSNVRSLTVSQHGYNGKPVIAGVQGNQLKMYWTDGKGRFVKTTTLGSGWDAMHIALAGDVTGEGWPDLWGITSDGTLRLYVAAHPSGTQFNAFNVGSGWSSVRHLLPNASTPTTLRAIFPDAVLRQYEATRVPRYLQSAPIYTPTKQPSSSPVYGSNMSVLLTEVQTESARFTGAGCHVRTLAEDSAKLCAYGTPGGKPTVALVGDSHASQWAPAFERLARQGDIYLLGGARDACSLQNRTWPDSKQEAEQCLRWKREMVQKLQEAKPDYLFLAYSLLSFPQTREHYLAAMDELAAQLPENTKVVLLRASPRFTANPVTCLQQNRSNPSACAQERSLILNSSFYGYDQLVAAKHGWYTLDLNDYVCDDQCYPAQGNVLVFKDAYHYTKTFSQLMAPQILNEVHSAGIF